MFVQLNMWHASHRVSLEREVAVGRGAVGRGAGRHSGRGGQPGGKRERRRPGGARGCGLSTDPES